MYTLALVSALPDPAVLAALRAQEAAGFQTVLCPGEAGGAVARLSAAPADVVLAELPEGDPDPLATARALRRKGLAACLILAGRDVRYEILRPALVLGAFDFLRLPVAPAELDAVLERARAFLKNSATLDLRVKDAAAKLARVLLDLPCVRDVYFSHVGRYVNHLFDVLCTDEGWQVRSVYLRADRCMIFLHGQALAREPWLSNFFSPGAFHIPWSQALTLDGIRAGLTAFVRELACLLSELAPGRVDGSGNPDKWRAYLLEHPEKDLSLSAVSAVFYINKTYLSYLFRQREGCSFGDYTARVKFWRARFLFWESGARICAVSCRLNFSDGSYFSKRYRTYMEGLSLEPFPARPGNPHR